MRVAYSPTAPVQRPVKRRDSARAGGLHYRRQSSELADIYRQSNNRRDPDTLPDVVQQVPRTSTTPLKCQPEDEETPSCHDSDSVFSDEEFDEEAYLLGKIPILRSSVDRVLPPRDDTKRIERERAPWERDHANDDTERDFDENAFLGRSNSEAENEQSDGEEGVAPVRTMHVLRRSESREKTPDNAWDSGSEGGDDGTIKNLVYVGRKIPSKTFQRLQKVMDRRASVDKQNDPRIDVDVAVDKIDIGTHEPDKYLDLLRKSVEEQMGVEVAVENDDTTDF